MRGMQNETLANAVDALTLKLGKSNRDLNEKIETLGRMDIQHKTLTATLSKARESKGHLKAEVDRKEEEIQSIEKFLEERGSTIFDLQQETANLNNHIITLNAAQELCTRTGQENLCLTRDIEYLKRERDRLKQERDEFEREKDFLKQKHDADLRKTKQDAATESQNAAQRYRLLDQRLQSEVQKLQISETSLDLLRQEKLHLEHRLYQATQTGQGKDQTVQNLQVQLTRVKEEANAEKTSLRKQLQSQEETLKRQHIADTRKLRSDAEDLKKAFVAREHFKGMRDRDITGKFTRLASEIEHISTLDWDQKSSSDWPLSESQMLQLHWENTRLLKQQIVQTSVWSLLYERVLRSPFRVMGAKGQQEDTQWLDIYGSGKSTHDTSALY